MAQPEIHGRIIEAYAAQKRGIDMIIENVSAYNASPRQLTHGLKGLRPYMSLLSEAIAIPSLAGDVLKQIRKISSKADRDPNYGTLVHDFVEANLSTYTHYASLSQERKVRDEACFRIANLSECGTPMQRKKALEVLSSALPKILMYREEVSPYLQGYQERHPGSFSEKFALEQLFLYGNSEQKKLARMAIVNLVGEDAYLQAKAVNIVADLLSGGRFRYIDPEKNPNDFAKGDVLHWEGYPLAKELLRKMGSDEPDDFVDAWLIGGKYKNWFDRVQVNREIMEVLEEIIPGSVMGLRREFGIRNFTRRSVEEWLLQYKDRNNTKLIHIPTFVAVADHNGAFLQSYNVFREGTEQLRDEGFADFKERVYEFGNEEELAKYLEASAGKYGGVDVLPILVHGSPDAIHPGKPTNVSSRVFVGSLERGSRLAKAFAAATNPDGKVILVSCSTGKDIEEDGDSKEENKHIKPGWGEKLYLTTGREVWAPGADTNIKSLQLFPVDGKKIDASIVYEDLMGGWIFSATGKRRGRQSTEF